MISPEKCSVVNFFITILLEKISSCQCMPTQIHNESHIFMNVKLLETVTCVCITINNTRVATVRTSEVSEILSLTVGFSAVVC